MEERPTRFERDGHGVGGGLQLGRLESLGPDRRPCPHRQQGHHVDAEHALDLEFVARPGVQEGEQRVGQAARLHAVRLGQPEFGVRRLQTRVGQQGDLDGGVRRKRFGQQLLDPPACVGDGGLVLRPHGLLARRLLHHLLRLTEPAVCRERRAPRRQRRQAHEQPVPEPPALTPGHHCSGTLCTPLITTPRSVISRVKANRWPTVT